MVRVIFLNFLTMVCISLILFFAVFIFGGPDNLKNNLQPLTLLLLMIFVALNICYLTWVYRGKIISFPKKLLYETVYVITKAFNDARNDSKK